MNFSLFVMFEGASGNGPVPLCRIADPEITRDAISRALDRAAQRSQGHEFDDETVRASIRQQEQDLRGILSLI